MSDRWQSAWDKGFKDGENGMAPPPARGHYYEQKANLMYRQGWGLGRKIREGSRLVQGELFSDI